MYEGDDAERWGGEEEWILAADFAPGCEPDGEHDRTDPAAVHALAYDGVQAVGTGRFYPLDARTVQLGRMAVLAEHRGKRAGVEILGALEAEAIRRGFERAHLWAQTHAIGFYGRAGFAAEGDTVWDGGILHQPMSHTLGGER